ncbi:MAG: hypothetical protein K0S67_806 [Nitrososphaeraceae archaeon]|jgi:hypothetical protein|nr:hypothetical protein [Nitrososphaeraceae archaeon]MCD6036918.1 hypothetical protein [Nitrososphaeraceae archaeon]MDF2769787.1 hypothetical protein [Nitrososphaeraceae archaeon]
MTSFINNIIWRFFAYYMSRKKESFIINHYKILLYKSTQKTVYSRLSSNKTSLSILMIATLPTLFTSLTTANTTINSYAQSGSTASLETIQAAYAVGII